MIEKRMLEVCSHSVKGTKGSLSACFTVDINPETKPDLVEDAPTLNGIPNNKFNRWRCDSFMLLDCFGFLNGPITVVTI